MHGTLRFLNISHLLYGIICVNIVIMKSVYLKELHNEQYYKLTIYRAGAAVVSTITSYKMFRCFEFSIAREHYIYLLRVFRYLSVDEYFIAYDTGRVGFVS